MALPESGRISIKDIKDVFGDPDNDGQFKFSEYYRGESSSRVVRPISRNANVPTTGEIRASQFYNSTNIFLDNQNTGNHGWPDTRLVGPFADAQNVNGTWNTVQGVAQSFSFPEAFAKIGFYHDPTNSRIVTYWQGGHSQTMSSTVYAYHNYVGLETATWEVRYTHDASSHIGETSYLPYGPLPSDNGYSEGVWQSLNSPVLFGWLAQASAGIQFAYITVNNLNLELRATLGSDVFLSGWQGGNAPPDEDVLLPILGKTNGINLQATYGNVKPPILPSAL
jgi:hypothetical protein